MAVFRYLVGNYRPNKYVNGSQGAKKYSGKAERRCDRIKLTKCEQETIINFDNGASEASIYTASPQMMKRLNILARDFPEHYRLIGQTEVSKTYSCDKNLITLRKPRKENEEHREWASRRMKEINIQKNMEKGELTYDQEL